MSDQDRLLSDEVVDSPTMTDKQFVDVLRAKLWRIHSKDIDNAEIAIENALEHIWSTMTRNARVEQQKRLYAESVKKQIVVTLSKQIAKYGDGEVVHFNGEAVVPISKVQAQINSNSES